jgi:mevalonate kinase
VAFTPEFLEDGIKKTQWRAFLRRSGLESFSLDLVTVLAYIKKPGKSTGELVSMVKSMEPGRREPRIRAIGQAAMEMRKALRERDSQKVSELINLAWDSLSALGLSLPEADEVIGRIRGIGGAAKLCGACGGGIMLAHHEDKENLKKTIREAGFSPWETELGADGARLE